MKITLNKNQISIIIEALYQEDTQQSNDLISYIENQLQSDCFSLCKLRLD